MATETIEPFESEAVSKSRSESAEGMEGVELHRTHPSSGTGYQAIKRHSTTITDAVSDQAHFARTRGDESLITDEGSGDATGGNATGGSAIGGNATEGNATGGSATGGNATGGSATEGNATGGGATGGGKGTGGLATGGSITGDSTTGGNASGGSATGGIVYSACTFYSTTGGSATEEKPAQVNPRKITRVTDKLSQTATAEMIATFNCLLIRISTILSRIMSMEIDKQTGETTFQNFRQYVASVCTSRMIRLKDSVQEIINEISDTRCFDTYGDPHDLLLIVVKGVENPKVIADVTAIIKECQAQYYSQYLVAISVVDHIATLQAIKLPDGVDYEPDFAKLSIKLDYVNVNECSVAYLIDLWKAVKICVRLPKLFSVLEHIEKGCLSVTWLVPFYAVSSLMDIPQSSPELLWKFSILRMSINKIIFYEVTSAALRATKEDEDPNTPSQAPQVPLQVEQQQQQQPAAQEGYDVQVVTDTQLVYDNHHYDCLVCQLIPKDPMQVTCCGKRFCRACITRIKSEMNVCPHCKAKGDDMFQYFEDGAHRQAILELKVYCSNKKQGCDWTGELCHLENHENKQCLLRPYTCPYCDLYTASYRDITGHHEPECEMFQVSCPFCAGKVARKNVHLHETECVKREPSLAPVSYNPVKEYLLELHKHIGNEWKILARELGFTTTDRDTIQHDNMLSLKEQIYQFTHKWEMMEGDDASIEKLRAGLQRADLLEVLSTVERNLKQRSNMRDKRLQRLGSSGSDATTPSSTTSGSGDVSASPFSFNPVSRKTSLPPLPIQESADVDTDSPLKNKQPDNSRAESDCTAVDSPADRHDTADSPLEVGDAVTVKRRDAAPWYGVIKYLGDLSGTGKMIAGMDLDVIEGVPGGTDGEYEGVRYFKCEDGHGLFLPVDLIARDDRFDSPVPSPADLNRSITDTPLDASSPHQPVVLSPSTVPSATSSTRANPPAQNFGSTPQASGGLESFVRDMMEKMVEGLGDEQTSETTGASEADSDTDTELFLGIVFQVPGDCVGILIGREGRTKSEIERETGTSIDIKKRDQHNLSTNGMGRISGSRENCQKALQLILRIVQKKIRQHVSTSKTISIPSRLCGKVIGKGGVTCRAIEGLSGAEIKIEKKHGWEAFLGDEDCRITGLSEEIEEAEKLIREAMAGADIAHRATLAVLIKILTEKFGFQFGDE